MDDFVVSSLWLEIGAQRRIYENSIRSAWGTRDHDYWRQAHHNNAGHKTAANIHETLAGINFAQRKEPKRMHTPAAVTKIQMAPALPL
jgi:hypothetical protein